MVNAGTLLYYPAMSFNNDTPLISAVRNFSAAFDRGCPSCEGINGDEMVPVCECNCAELEKLYEQMTTELKKHDQNIHDIP